MRRLWRVRRFEGWQRILGDGWDVISLDCLTVAIVLFRGITYGDSRCKVEAFFEAIFGMRKQTRTSILFKGLFLCL